MLRKPWGIVVAAAIAASIVLAMRDLHGYSSDEPVHWLPYVFHDKLRALVRLLMLAIAGAVAWKRYDRREARILTTALVGLSLNNNWWFGDVRDSWTWVSAALNYVGIAVGLTEFLRFAAIYGDADWHGVRAMIARVAPYIGAWILFFGTAWWLSELIDPGSLRPYSLINVAFWLGWDAVNILAIVAALIGVYAVSAAERTRMQWVAASFGIAAFGTAIHGFDRLVQGDTAWANAIDAVTLAALPIGLGYVIRRHRLLDIQFLVTRGALYSLLGVLLYYGFSALEVFAHERLGEVPLVRNLLQPPIGAFSVSFALVLGMRGLESRFDRLLHGAFYGRIESQEAALRDFRSQLEQISEPRELQDRLLNVLSNHAGGDGVGLYEHQRDRFECVGATYDALPRDVSEIDPGVTVLERANGPCITPPEGAIPNKLGLPMTARRALRGFAVCDGAEKCDPRLQTALYETAAAAALALDDLRVADLERKVEQLQKREMT